MSAEVWTIISAAIVILIAIATSHRALRRELNERMAEMRRELNERMAEMRREMNERIDGLGERVTDLRTEMIERITGLRAEMIERFGQLSERLARVESFLEGMGYAQWKRATKERRDGEH